MKKTLVALAALAATGAFAQVSIVGTFDPSIAFATTTYSNGNSVSQSFVRNNSQGTSQVTFKGEEDLGGGLKASFLIETDFSAAAGSSWNVGGGEVYTGLAGSMGTLKLGAPNTPTLISQASRQPFGTKIGGGFGGVLGTGRVRSDNSVNYQSPVIGGGFSATATYVFPTNVNANTAGAAVEAITDIGLSYAAGPLLVMATQWRQNGVNQTTELVGNYDFGVAKLYIGTHNETTTAAGVDNQYTGYNLGAGIPVGAATILFNYGTLDDKGAGNLDKTIAALGARYNLSKRTSVYARYVAEKNDNVPAAPITGISNVNTTLFGIQHNF